MALGWGFVGASWRGNLLLDEVFLRGYNEGKVDDEEREQIFRLLIETLLFDNYAL